MIFKDVGEIVYEENDKVQFVWDSQLLKGTVKKVFAFADTMNVQTDDGSYYKVKFENAYPLEEVKEESEEDLKKKILDLDEQKMLSRRQIIEVSADVIESYVKKSKMDFEDGLKIVVIGGILSSAIIAELFNGEND